MRIKRGNKRRVGLTDFGILPLLSLALLSAGTTANTARQPIDASISERVNLSAKIAKSQVEIERLDSQLSRLQIDRLPITPTRFKDLYLAYEGAKDGLTLALQEYLRAVKSEVEEWGNSNLKNQLDRAKNDVFFSNVLEVALYVVGFKWLWGAFTGYASTFLESNKDRVDRIYSTVAGRGVHSPRVGSPLANQLINRYKDKIEGYLIDLQRAVRAFQLELANTPYEATFKTALANLIAFGQGFDSYIERREEDLLTTIDSKRAVVDNYPLYLRLSSQQQLDTLLDTKEKLAKGHNFSSTVTTLLDYIDQEIENYKLTDVYQRIAQMSFREASAPPVSLVDIANGFEGVNSFQSQNLSAFRGWKLGSLYRVNQLRQEGSRIRAKVNQALNKLRSEAQRADAEIRVGFEQVHLLLNQSMMDIRSALRELSDNYKVDTYSTIASELIASLNQQIGGTNELLEGEIRDKVGSVSSSKFIRERLEELRTTIKADRERLARLQPKRR